MKKLISTIAAVALLATPVAANANAGDIIVGVILGVVGHSVLDDRDGLRDRYRPGRYDRHARHNRYDRHNRYEENDRYKHYRRESRGYYVNPGRPRSEDRCVFVKSLDYYGDPTIIQIC